MLAAHRQAASVSPTFPMCLMASAIAPLRPIRENGAGGCYAASEAAPDPAGAHTACPASRPVCSPRSKIGIPATSVAS